MRDIDSAELLFKKELAESSFSDYVKESFNRATKRDYNPASEPNLLFRGFMMLKFRLKAVFLKYSIERSIESRLCKIQHHSAVYLDHWPENLLLQMNHPVFSIIERLDDFLEVERFLVSSGSLSQNRRYNSMHSSSNKKLLLGVWLLLFENGYFVPCWKDKKGNRTKLTMQVVIDRLSTHYGIARMDLVKTDSKQLIQLARKKVQVIEELEKRKLNDDLSNR